MISEFHENKNKSRNKSPGLLPRRLPPAAICGYTRPRSLGTVQFCQLKKRELVFLPQWVENSTYIYEISPPTYSAV